MRNNSIYHINFYIAICLCGLLYACSDSQSSANRSQEPVEFGVLTLKPESITLYSSFPATLEGKENIEIRPKVEGFIEKVLIDEGEEVKKGQLLFILNAPQYEQEVRNAEAAISSAKADVSSAEIGVEKAKPLVEREIISKFELVSAQNTLEAAKAALAQAKVNLANAQTNLGYTRITSPVTGVVGTLPYKLGSLVSSTTTEPLTTISNIDKVYAYFSINEKTQLNFFRNAKGNSIKEQISNLPDVELMLADNSMYENKGRIETISGQVDEETGSFNVRAVFDNPRGILRTGNSANLRIPSHRDNALLIPQAATYEIQGNTFAYVVDDQSQANSTKIKVTATPSGQAYVVTEGLKANDKVVIEGINSLSDGDKITVSEVSRDSVKALQKEISTAKTDEQQ